LLIILVDEKLSTTVIR